MEFGEIRSRIHNGKPIYWEEVKRLSEREDYREVVEPYISGFDAYWRKHSYFVSLTAELRESVFVAPFAYFRMTNIHLKLSLGFTREEYKRLVRFYPYTIKRAEFHELLKCPHFENLTYLNIRIEEGFSMGDAEMISRCENFPVLEKLVLEVLCDLVGEVEGILESRGFYKNAEIKISEI